MTNAFDRFDPPAALAAPIPDELKKSMQEMQRQVDVTVATNIATTIQERTAATAAVTADEKNWVSYHAMKMLLTSAATLCLADGCKKQDFVLLAEFIFDDVAPIYLGRMSADQTGSRQ